MCVWGRGGGRRVRGSGGSKTSKFRRLQERERERGKKRRREATPVSHNSLVAWLPPARPETCIRQQGSPAAILQVLIESIRVCSGSGTRLARWGEGRDQGQVWEGAVRCLFGTLGACWVEKKVTEYVFKCVCVLCVRVCRKRRSMRSEESGKCR